MSFKGTLIFLILVAAAPFVYLKSGVGAKEFPVLLNGTFSSGVIERCDYRTEKRGTISRNGKFSGGLGRAYFPVAKFGEEMEAVGSGLFPKEWCEKQRGKKVYVLYNEDVQRIISFSQFFAPVFGASVLIISGLLLFIAYNVKSCRKLYKPAEIVSTAGVLLGAALLFIEYLM